MTDFYEKTGGITLLVIKHNGDSFDYVNGKKANKYYDKPIWNAIRPLMTEGYFYVLVCFVKPGTHSLFPIGIAFQIENEEYAKEVSFEHVKSVIDGTWNPEVELIKLKKDIIEFKEKYFELVDKEVEKLKLKLIGHTGYRV